LAKPAVIRFSVSASSGALNRTVPIAHSMRNSTVAGDVRIAAVDCVANIEGSASASATASPASITGSNAGA